MLGQCFKSAIRSFRSTSLSLKRWNSYNHHPEVETDSCGVPLKPTWSVKELLSSYPSPSITHEAFHRLHELSALLPLGEGTPEYVEMKDQLEELVKLVEAVRLVDIDALTQGGLEEGPIPDGRIWPKGVGLPLMQRSTDEEVPPCGEELLVHASRTESGLYVIEMERDI